MIKSKLNKKGVFGLTAVQSFFVIILGIALLAYVIVIIMGTLSSTTILQSTSATYVNDSITVTTAGTALTCNSFSGASCGTITNVQNSTGYTINSGNYTQTGCLLANKTDATPYSTTWLVNYPCTYNSNSQNNLNSILINTSTGITAFFSSINPVYAILAVLVIILVLIVLVRVVQSPNTSTREQL